MVIAITGASGHIGANLVRAFLDTGRQVRVLVRDDTRAVETLDVERVCGDVRDPESVRALVRGADVVYHLAAHIALGGRNKGEILRVNVHGTRNVVSACLDHRVRRLVHFSSLHAISDAPTVDETSDLARGHGHRYEVSKAEAENEIIRGAKRGLETITLNPGGVIGRFDYKPSLMGRVLIDLFHRRLPALITGGYPWVDVRDVVAAATAAETGGRSGERYILAGEWTSLEEISQIAESITGVRSPRMIAPSWLAQIGARVIAQYAKLSNTPPRFTPDSVRILGGHKNVRVEKAKAELGFSAREIKETIEDSYDWFQSHGVLAR